MIHELKTWPEYFERVRLGTKTFEVRKDDRGYQTGDTLVLREWDPEACRCPGDHRENCSGWTGRAIERQVGFIFRRGFGLDCGEHVVMSLVTVDPEPDVTDHLAEVLTWDPQPGQCLCCGGRGGWWSAGFREGCTRCGGDGWDPARGEAWFEALVAPLQGGGVP